MDSTKKITVTLVNRNYPPNKGITGESAAQLAAFLDAHGVAIRVVTVANSNYGGGSDKGSSIGEVHGIRTFYNGKNKMLRLMASLLEGYTMIRKARKLRSDWTIVMTDPPMLNFFAAWLLKKNHRWMNWSMDIYPDAFVSAGLLKKAGVIAQYIRKVITKYPPSVNIALGPVQHAFIRETYYPGAQFVELPCGIYAASPATVVPEWRKDDGKIYLGYCGNIGEAHSLPFLKSVIDHLDPSRFRLVLALYGANAPELTQYAQGKEGIIFLPGVSRDMLGYIDVHLATLQENWVNVCVPSKTVSSVCAGSAFLYHGIKTSDNWELLQQAGWNIEPTDDLDKSVPAFLSRLNTALIGEKKKEAARLASSLVQMQNEAFASVLRKVKGNPVAQAAPVLP